VPANRVSNAFRLLGSGELSMPLGPVFFPFGSQMPFGFWVLGNSAWKNPPYRQPICLKFLSAFGFWGTIIKKTDGGRVMASLKFLSAFGFWGTLSSHKLSKIAALSLKFLSAFGFWGTEDGTIEVPAGGQSLKCLSAFGFWGTAEALGSGIKKASIVSNAFRLLGSGEPQFDL